MAKYVLRTDRYTKKVNDHHTIKTLTRQTNKQTYRLAAVLLAT